MSVSKIGRLLVVDDEFELMTALCQLLQEQGYETLGFTSPGQALSALKERDFDLLVSDLMMPEMDGITLLQRALEIDPHLIGVIMTGQGTVQTAVDAMKVGAFDYVLKPFKLNTLLPILSRGMEVRRLRLENVQLHEMVAIHELCRAMTFTLDRDTLLSKTVQGALHQCRADEASILLRTAEDDALYVAAVGGAHSLKLTSVRVPIDSHIAGWVARNKEPLILQGEVRDPRFTPLRPRQDIRAAISMPMLSGGNLIGVLNVNATQARATFTPGQVKALSILASAAASALETSTLYRQVAESEEKFRSIVETSEEWIWARSKDLRMTYNNPAIERILGFSPQELLGQDCLGYLHPEDRRLAEESVAKCIADKSGWNGLVIRWRHKDGSYRYFESNARPMFDAAGDLVGFRGVDRDITGRKELESQLRQAQRMEAVGRLAGGVAHDFNNLLAIIGGYSELLLERLGPEDPNREEIEEIEAAADRAASLTRQLLAFSRKQVLEPRIIDLNSVVAGLVRMLPRLLGEDIKLITKLNPGLGHVLIDTGQMEQVIMNLVVNARDAMPKGGSLTIETDNIELTDEYAHQHVGVSPGNYVMLAISDTGIGMDAKTVEHIFEPFFTTKKEGTGLGLATVFGIIKQSGGNIWVYSEPEHGTTFKIYLRRVDQPAEPAESSADTAERPSGIETLLLVEDEERLRRLVRKFLVSIGYTVLEATNGVDALRVANEYDGTIDLLLTDVVMPESSGRDLANKLLAVRPKIKTLFMSGYTDDAIAHHGVLEPGTHLIVKPFSRQALARKIRAVLAK